MTDRRELADFLSRCRARLTPVDVGLPPGARRRTPGLRREEVAGMVGLSVDYYARLEQARGPQPSPPLLAALARALRLSDDERDHLFHLVGHEPPRGRRALTCAPGAAADPGPPARHARPGALRPRRRAGAEPDGAALSGPLSQLRPGERNIVRRWFTVPGARDRFPAADHEELGRAHVANLRAVHAARPTDPEAAGLVAELLAASAEFRELWERHDVAVRRSGRKTFLHPVVGPLELDCEVLAGSGEGQVLVVLTARPGSDAAGRLELLRVVGQQQLADQQS